MLFLIERTDLRIRLEKKGYSSPKVFAKGKRGIILTARYRNNDVAIKLKKESSAALGTIENEARFLRLLNKQNIGPKLIESDSEMLVYTFVDGLPIEDFIMQANKTQILSTLDDVLKQLHAMDKLEINKFEMHHPVKHILVTISGPVMIDFERCRRTHHPKNVTQFLDYMRGLRSVLAKKGIGMVEDEVLKDISKRYRLEKKTIRCKDLTVPEKRV